MGLLRLLLALSVVIYHCGFLFGYNILTSSLAVSSFFVISGFYMALVLDTKYSKSSTLVFYKNRFLRIFPTYLFILGLTLAFTLLKFFFHLGTPDNAIAHYFDNTSLSVGAQIIEGLNIVLRNITLIITTDYFSIQNKDVGYLLVQQAWTLQIELLFYLVVPYLLRLSRGIFLIGVGLYTILFFGFLLPIVITPSPNLTIIFFIQLIYFLLGILSYRYIYKNIKNYVTFSRMVVLFSALLLMYVLIYHFIPYKIKLPILEMSDFPYILFLTVSIPFLFQFTKKNAFDRFVGELSYPVYISHLFILKFISNIPYLKENSDYKTFFVIASTLLFSMGIVKFLEEPIDRYRQRQIQKQGR